jgi:hypothetical protein
MATIKRTTVEQSAAGRKLVKVVFTPQTPNPAAEPDVEVVFEIKKAETVSLDADPLGAVIRSCTQMDTREPYTLTTAQWDAVVEAALEKAAEDEGW